MDIGVVPEHRLLNGVTPARQHAGTPSVICHALRA